MQVSLSEYIKGIPWVIVNIKDLFIVLEIFANQSNLCNTKDIYITNSNHDAYGITFVSENDCESYRGLLVLRITIHKWVDTVIYR